MTIAIIPARSGSVRIPGKNIRKFHGKPIIAYAIEAARSSGLFDEIVVSTDSAEYVAVAKAYGAKAHMRARRLAKDEVGTQEVARAVLEWWLVNRGERAVPELACCIYPATPLLTSSDLIVGLAALDGYYAYVPGLYYFGPSKAFLDGIPLDAGREVPYPQGRYIDINTEEDWQRAERLYQDLQDQRIAEEQNQ